MNLFVELQSYALPTELSNHVCRGKCAIMYWKSLLPEDAILPKCSVLIFRSLGPIPALTIPFLNQRPLRESDKIFVRLKPRPRLTKRERARQAAKPRRTPPVALQAYSAVCPVVIRSREEGRKPRVRVMSTVAVLVGNPGATRHPRALPDQDGVWSSALAQL
jgi:hypothetical protein